MRFCPPGQMREERHSPTIVEYSTPSISTHRTCCYFFRRADGCTLAPMNSYIS